MKSLIYSITLKNYYFGLSCITALLLALSFPPFPLGVVACVALVPFLILTEQTSSYARFFRYAYLTFFIFTLCTLYWVGGFTHLKDPYLMIAGIALFLWQPLFFTLPASLYFFVRKNLPGVYSIYAFPFIWILMEWLYAYGEFAFPWLTLGNTQTYQLQKIQYIDITGVYGVSFWVILINILVFQLFFLTKKDQSTSRAVLLVAIVVLYVLPNLYGSKIASDYMNSDKHNEINIGIMQPNIDPWEKWEGSKTFEGRWRQVQYFLSVIGSKVNDSLDVVVLPESAILLNLPAFPEQMNYVKNVIDSLNVSLISGYIRFQYYEPDNAPASSSIVKGSNLRWDSFNSIFYAEPGEKSIQTYSKMRLVPFAERIPYAESVPFLIEPLRWGVGISNWGKGKDSTIFSSNRLQTKFLAMVCYESIFPEFVGSFVSKGAEFLVFITNDSWWGNTSGARQHHQYAVLRAIENRRWVVRCANGGISSFIDPMGNSYQDTEMYDAAFIHQRITPLKDKTFYSMHGDVFARICSIMAVVTIILATGYNYYRKRI